MNENKTNDLKNKISEIGTELYCLSSLITSLYVCVDNSQDGGASLTPESISNALFAIKNYVDRISENLLECSE